jgi:isochorismate synthase
LYFAENFEEVGLFLLLLKAAKILIPYQSVKWSALLTSGKETRDSDFAKSENKQNQEYFESLCKRNDSIHEGFSKKVVVSRKEIIETIILI